MEQAAAERLTMLTLLVGNRHVMVNNPRRSKNGKHINRHKWTAFVELQQNSTSIDEFVEKVYFKLAPYYTTWPSNDNHSVRVGKNPEVRSAPFEVTRVGWGYFPVTIVITWKAWLAIPPTEIEHELCFDGSGSSSTHRVDVDVKSRKFDDPSSTAGRSGRSASSARRSTSGSRRIRR
jgi:transcription initiation factor IIF auxiliary subunit